MLGRTNVTWTFYFDVYPLIGILSCGRQSFCQSSHRSCQPASDATPRLKIKYKSNLEMRHPCNCRNVSKNLLYVITLRTEGIVLIHWLGRLALDIEVANLLCWTVFKAATGTGRVIFPHFLAVAIASAGPNVFNRSETGDRAPAPNVASIFGVGGRTCWF